MCARVYMCESAYARTCLHVLTCMYTIYTLCCMCMYIHMGMYTVCMYVSTCVFSHVHMSKHILCVASVLMCVLCACRSVDHSSHQLLPGATHKEDEPLPLLPT